MYLQMWLNICSPKSPERPPTNLFHHKHESLISKKKKWFWSLFCINQDNLGYICGSNRSYLAWGASPLYQGWRMCASDRSHHLLGFWRARFWCCRRGSAETEGRISITQTGKRGEDRPHLCGGIADRQTHASPPRSPQTHYKQILTLRSSSGRSPPSLMPLFMEIKRSTGGLSLTLGLWRLVFSMMIANDRT